MARVLRQPIQVADGNADTKVTEPTNHAKAFLHQVSPDRDHRL